MFFLLDLQSVSVYMLTFSFKNIPKRILLILTPYLYIYKLNNLPALKEVSSFIRHFHKNQRRMMGFAAFERKIRALSFAFLRTSLALFVWKWQQYEVHIDFYKATGAPHTMTRSS